MRYSDQSSDPVCVPYPQLIDKRTSARERIIIGRNILPPHRRHVLLVQLKPRLSNCPYKPTMALPKTLVPTSYGNVVRRQAHAFSMPRDYQIMRHHDRSCRWLNIFPWSAVTLYVLDQHLDRGIAPGQNG